MRPGFTLSSLTDPCDEPEADDLVLSASDGFCVIVDEPMWVAGRFRSALPPDTLLPFVCAFLLTECRDAPEDRLARVTVPVVKCTGELAVEDNAPPEPPPAPAVLTLNVDDADRRLERAVTADDVDEYVLAVLYVAFSLVELVLTLDIGRDDTVDLRGGAPCRPGEGRSELGPGTFRRVDDVDRIDDADDFARRDGGEPVASFGKVLVRDMVFPLRRIVRDALLIMDGGITILLMSVFFTDIVEVIEFASELGSGSLTLTSSTRACPSV